MKKEIRLLIAVGLAVSASCASAADITGKIVLKGAPPEEVVIPLDPQCGRLHSEKLTTRFYEVADDGGLKDVFVHITKGLGDKKFEVPSEPVILDQVGCEYVPYVLGAQVGQTIEVRNSDPLLHNVHPTPKTPGNREYNKAQLPKGPALTFKWDKPEVFLRFKCDVHPWMFSYVGLVEHPFFSTTDKEGKFALKDVPAGTYTIEAFHRKIGKIEREVTISDKDQKLDFTFEVKQ